MTKADKVAAVDEFKVRYAEKRAVEEAAKVDEKPIDLNEQVIANKEPYVERHSLPSAPIVSTQFLYRIEEVSPAELSQDSANSIKL